MNPNIWDGKTPGSNLDEQLYKDIVNSTEHSTEVSLRTRNYIAEGINQFVFAHYKYDYNLLMPPNTHREIVRNAKSFTKLYSYLDLFKKGLA